MLKFVLVVVLVALVVYVVVGALARRQARPLPPPEVAPEDREDFLWQVRERARQQRRSAGGPQGGSSPAPPLVTIDPDVLSHHNERFMVVSDAATAAVIRAIERANQRFMLVDELGREHTDSDAMHVAFDQHPDQDDLYTPNYAAAPRPTADGIVGYLDCKGGIDPMMGETLRRVLREELEALKAKTRVSVPADE